MNQKNLSEKICVWIIKLAVFAALLTPLVVSDKFLFPFVGPKSLWFMAFAEIAFAAYLFLALSCRKYRPRLNSLVIALLAFLTVFILSSVLGVDFEESFWSRFERMTGLLMWFHLFGFFLTLSSTFREKKDWIQIFSFSVAAAMAVSFLFIFEKIIEGQQSLPGAAQSLASSLDKIGLLNVEKGRGGATLGNSSFLGTYLLFNLFIALYLFFQTNKQKICSRLHEAINFLYLLSVGVIGLVLYFSTARAAFLSAAGGLALLGILWLAFANKGNVRKAGISLLCLSCVCALAIVVLIFFSPAFLEDNLEKMFGTSTIKPRFAVYEMAWKGFLERPLLGWGPENFSIAFTKYFSPSFFTEDFGGDIWYDKSHNVVFDTLVTTGLLGLISYFGIYAASFYLLWKKFFREKEDFWKAGIFSVALIAYFVQNLTVFDMIGSYLMFFLILSFISSDSGNKEEAGEAKLKFWLLPLLLIVLAFSLANFVVSPAQKAYYAILPRQQEPFSESRLEMYEKTASTSFVGQDQIIESFANSTIEFSYYQDIESVPAERVAAEFGFLMAELEKIVEKNPLDYRMVLELGTIYNTYIRFDPYYISKAEKVFKDAITLSPNNQQGYWYLAQTKLYEGKMEEAVTLAEKALQLDQKAERSHLVLVQVLKFSGNQEKLQEAVLNALEINPEWATSIESLVGQL